MKQGHQDKDSVDGLMTVAEVSAVLGMSTVFVYRQITERKIAIYRLGGQSIRIHRNALSDYLERHHQSSFDPIKPSRKHF